MASGIEVSSEVSELYSNVKLKREAYKYVIFHIENQKAITTFKLGPKLERDTESKEEDRVHFEELKAELLERKEPRYVIYDFGFTSAEGRKLHKIAFIFYSPDTGAIKPKMLYASSKDSVRKVLTGLTQEFQANEAQDLDYDEWASEIEKKA